MSIVLAIATANLPGHDFKAEMSRLADTIQADIDAKLKQKSVKQQERAATEAMLLTQLRNLIAQDRHTVADSILNQLLPLIDSGTLRKQCKDAAMQMQRLRQEKEKLVAQELDGLCKEAASVIRGATKPADLDAILEKLEALHLKGVAEDYRLAFSGEPSRLDAARQFVKRWQDYLAQLAAGEIEKGRTILQGLSDSDRAGLISRSEILVRVHRPAEGLDLTKAFQTDVDEVLNGIKTVDQVSAAITALNGIDEARHSHNIRNSEVSTAIAALTPLDQAYASFKAGFATDVELVAYDRSWYPNIVLPLRAQLLALILPRYLGLEGRENIKPDETIYEFLKRIAADAKAHGDYLLAARAHETEDLLIQGIKNRSPDGLQATYFIIAQKQEAAGQFSVAVISYEQALASGSDLVPADVIGKRLAAIKSQHPQEFQQGEDQYVRPAYAASGMRMGPGWVPALRQPPDTGQKLAVPAATGKPSPTATKP